MEVQAGVVIKRQVGDLKVRLQVPLNFVVKDNGGGGNVGNRFAAVHGQVRNWKRAVSWSGKMEVGGAFPKRRLSDWGKDLQLTRVREGWGKAVPHHGRKHGGRRVTFRDSNCRHWGIRCVKKGLVTSQRPVVGRGPGRGGRCIG